MMPLRLLLIALVSLRLQVASSFLVSGETRRLRGTVVVQRVDHRLVATTDPLEHSHKSYFEYSSLEGARKPSLLFLRNSSPVERHAVNPFCYAKRYCRALTLRILPMLRRKVVTLAIAVLLFLSTALNAQAVSAGRAGGSFGPSSSYSPRSSSSSSSMSSPRQSYSSRPRQQHRSYYRFAPPPQIRVYRNYGPGISVITKAPSLPFQPATTMASPASRQFSASDVVILTGTGALLTYGFLHKARRNYDDDNNGSSHRTSPLGAGATVASIVVALTVPNRNDPYNVLHQIRDASDRADTTTRKGVQNLVSDVALHVLRNEASIVSACTQSAHFKTPELAQRAFQQESIRNRAKFDRETVNKFGDDDRSTRNLSNDSSSEKESPSATAAVVSINVAMEGESSTTQLPTIRHRSDIREALTQMASQVQVGECLLSAEVLWAPDDDAEDWTIREIVADYPDLAPL